MAVRSNVGNIVTNGTQILSVSATNAADRFGKSAQMARKRQMFEAGVNEQYLNNLSEKYGYTADDIASAKARDTVAWIKGKDNEVKSSGNEVADALEGVPQANLNPISQSPQIGNVEEYIQNNVKYNRQLVYRYTNPNTHKFVKDPTKKENE